MATIVKLFKEDFPRISSLLNQFSSTHVSTDQFEKIFSYNWPRSESHGGLGIEEDGKIVGFAGHIFCNREILGQQKKFLNLSTWIVLDKFRHEAISLVLQIREYHDYVITIFTPSQQVYEIFTALGFKAFETNYIALPVRPINTGSVRIVTDPIEIRSHLNQFDLTLMQHHCSYKLGYFFFEHEGQHCFGIYHRAFHIRMKAARILYISNPELFAACAASVIFAVWQSSKALWMLIDRRLLCGEKIRLSITRTYRRPLLARSEDLPPELIDGLYSERVFFG
jgi:hypothetical protein